MTLTQFIKNNDTKKERENIMTQVYTKIANNYTCEINQVGNNFIAKFIAKGCYIAFPFITKQDCITFFNSKIEKLELNK